MNGACICIGDYKELSQLIGDIKMLSGRGKPPVVILDKGMAAPSFLEPYASIHTDIEPDLPIRKGWNVHLLVVTHRSIIGKHLVEHWERPPVKFLYQGLYAPTPEWLGVQHHLHTVWGLMDVCVQGFDSPDLWIVDASRYGEITPGPRFLEHVG